MYERYLPIDSDADSDDDDASSSSRAVVARSFVRSCISCIHSDIWKNSRPFENDEAMDE